MNKSKSHIGYTRLSKKHLDNYLKEKSFTVKPSDHNDESNTAVKLHYKTKKNLSKLQRNLANNKGTRVLPDELHLLEVHTGKGIFDSIKKVVSSPIVKDVVKAATPAIADMIGNQVSAMTGSQTAGDVSKSLVNSGSNAYTGSGFNLHTIGLGIKHAKGKKHVGGSFQPMGGSLTYNSAMPICIAKKSGGNIALSKLTEPQQFTGIGYNAQSFSNPNQEKMHKVRSFKNHNGIVMG